VIEIDNITRGIAAHAKWKFYLRQAINTGESEWTVATARVDDRCEFGAWLHGLPAEQRLGEHFKTVSEQHAAFHRAAAEVLELALAGRRAEAEAAIADASRFAGVSRKLTLAMMAWKDAGGAA
jgi:hypothetical protein